jgi:hypothetical protein
LLPYLGHSDAGFRADVARALAHQAGMANVIVPALVTACASERDEETRNAMRSALDVLGHGSG